MPLNKENEPNQNNSNEAVIDIHQSPRQEPHHQMQFNIIPKTQNIYIYIYIYENLLMMDKTM